MTTNEIAKEWEYRMQERLALSVGAGKPTAGHFATAKREADEWRAEWLKQEARENEP